MKRIQFFTGFLCGILFLSVFSASATAASGIMAFISNQSIYVDGQRVSMTAYSIGGNNYVKLRDIGKAVDFSVVYDAGTNSVYIGTKAHYQEQVTRSVQTTPAPSSGLTEESVYNVLMSLKAQYPHGTPYGSPYQPIVRLYSNSNNCAGWAMKCSDAAFGNLPYRTINNPSWDQIRVGDIVEYRTERSGHGVVVVVKTDDYIEVTESGSHNKAFWGGQYFRWWLEQQPGYTLRTRYPA